MSNFFMKTNYFGYDIYSPLFLFHESNVRVQEFVKERFSELFLALNRDIDESFSFENIEKKCQNAASMVVNGEIMRAQAELKVENELRSEFENHASLKRELYDRAKIIHDQLLKPLNNHFDNYDAEINFLDFGCGDGLVSQNIYKSGKTGQLSFSLNKIVLADIYDYRADEIRDAQDKYIYIPIQEGHHNLNLKVVDEEEELLFDCILLSTVLHHSWDPQNVFRNCYKLLKPGGVMAIIESCVAITANHVLRHPNVQGQYLNNGNHSVNQFTSMDIHEQTLYGTFFDWFYNRVLHDNVQVTYQFGSPFAWNELFEEFHGIKCVNTFFEGFDQRTVPEFHTLHILKKEII